MGIQGVPLALTKNDISEALKECRGIIAHAAEKLGCHKDTVYESLKKYPELEEVLRLARIENDKRRIHENERLRELSYQSIEDLLQKRDVVATLFTLKSLSGWNDKQGQNQNIQINLNSKPFQQMLEQAVQDPS